MTAAAGSGGLLTDDFVGTVPTPSITGGTVNGEDVVFTFGTISVTGNNITTDNAFLILVTASVLDVVGNAGFNPPGQTTLANSATFDITGDGQSAITSGPVNVTVVEPRMVIGKNIVQTGADAGAPVTVVLTVNNTGTTPPTTWWWKISFPPNLTRATANTGVSGTDYPVGLHRLLQLRHRGSRLLRWHHPRRRDRTFTFTVNLANSVAPGSTVTNTAFVTQATTLQGTVPGERDEPDVNAGDSLTIYTHAVSGFVYADANNDGTKQGGETGLSSVTVTLTGTDHLGNPVSLTTTTAGDGSYSFTGLRPGSYVVTETQPAGYLDGKETVGSTYGGSVNNLVDNQVIPGLSIPTGGPSSSGANYNFGEILPNSLAGTVYNDLNNNGAYNSGTDRGIYGVTVTLTGTDDRGNPVSIPTTTAADGSYSFPNLRPGTYTITETQPNGYTDSTDTVGSTGGTLANDVLASITLTQNQNGTGYNFGEVGPGSIGDTVFIDLNNNGLPDAGEGIGGVTVRLQGDLNGDGTLDTISAVTDATGHYLFDHLPAPTGGQNYTVTVLSGVASGLTQTVDPDGTLDATSVVNLTAASPANLNQDFGYRGSGQIGDRIFADINNNGQWDAGEGLAGVTVTLSGDVDGDGTSEIITATTGADGYYLFSGLRTTPAGVNYTVTVSTGTLPVDLVNNTVDPDGGGNSTAALSLTDAAASNLAQDFGYRGNAALGNYVWLDLNANGLKDVGETGVNNVTVGLLCDANNDGDFNDAGESTPVQTTTTTGGGFYNFAQLRPGNYQVIIPSTMFGSGQALENAPLSASPAVNLDNQVDNDNNGIQAGGTGTTVNSPMITLANAETDNTVDFGFVPNSSLAAIGNQVWADTNNDGLLNNGETGINGVTVQLFLQGKVPGTDAPFASTTTATIGPNAGIYSFVNLPPGNYFVYLPTPPAAAPLSSTPTDTSDDGVNNDDNGIQTGGSGAPVTSPIIALAVGETDNTLDFGFVPNSSLVAIGNLVWTNTNNNGVKDASETGIDGVTVQLLFDANNDGDFTDPGESTPVASLLTSGGGAYSFTSLPPGNYQVAIPTPASAPLSSTLTDTSDDGVNNDDNGIQTGGSGTSVTSPLIALSSGETDNTLDFGFVPNSGLASIGNLVWTDTNNNGVKDASETGIDGVTVQLLFDANNDGDFTDPGESTPVASLLTSGGGAYSFTSLPPGNYQVAIPTPPASAPLSSTLTDTSDDGVNNDDNGIQTGGSGTASHQSCHRTVQRRNR